MSDKGIRSRTFWLVCFIMLTATYLTIIEMMPAPLWVTSVMGGLAQWLGGKYVAGKNGNGGSE